MASRLGSIWGGWGSKGGECGMWVWERGEEVMIEGVCVCVVYPDLSS